jgi:fumarylacetoacetate (FAA) hydrolase family protein
MSTVGTGADAGLHPASSWNNPEPEIVLIVASDGRIVGATLGNDVNLRDVEGRSALLLGKAKDNNAAAAVGPFIRLFDAGFTLDHVRRTTVTLTVEGEDGFRLEGSSSIAKISRDPADLAAQMIGPHHQYPDGAALYLGTMFAPIKDRDAPGGGFTHKYGDIVTIAAPELGSLVNRMKRTDECAPWTYGASHLMRHLAGRGLI